MNWAVRRVIRREMVLVVLGSLWQQWRLLSMYDHNHHHHVNDDNYLCGQFCNLKCTQVWRIAKRRAKNHHHKKRATKQNGPKRGLPIPNNYHHFDNNPLEAIFAMFYCYLTFPFTLETSASLHMYCRTLSFGGYLCNVLPLHFIFWRIATLEGRECTNCMLLLIANFTITIHLSPSSSSSSLLLSSSFTYHYCHYIIRIILIVVMLHKLAGQNDN